MTAEQNKVLVRRLAAEAVNPATWVCWPRYPRASSPWQHAAGSGRSTSSSSPSTTSSRYACPRRCGQRRRSSLARRWGEAAARSQAAPAARPGDGRRAGLGAGHRAARAVRRGSRQKSDRERRGVLDSIVAKVLGLDMKLAQYRRGKAFADEVVSAHGIRTLNRAWRGPDDLPRPDELDRHPQQPQRADRRMIERRHHVPCG